MRAFRTERSSLLHVVVFGVLLYGIIKNSGVVEAVTRDASRVTESDSDGSDEDGGGGSQEDSEFQPLSDPYRRIGGAYVGGGLDFSHMSYDVRLFEDDDEKLTSKVSKTAFQPALSLVGGFGTTFYKDWYAGLEFEFFKRFPKSTKKDGKVEVIFKSTLGFNMDARLGYQFPKSGIMVYLGVGFARVLGAMSARENDKVKPTVKTFGSFFPTISGGIAYKMNQNWIVQATVRYSIGSKEKKHFMYPSDIAKFEQNIKDKKEDPTEGLAKRAMEGKPTRWGFGIYVVRQI